MCIDSLLELNVLRPAMLGIRVIDALHLASATLLDRRDDYHALLLGFSFRLLHTDLLLIYLHALLGSYMYTLQDPRAVITYPTLTANRFMTVD